MLQQTVTLGAQAEVFRRSGLYGTVFQPRWGTYLPKGTKVVIGEAEYVFWAGLKEVAVSFVASDGKTYWLLVERAGIDMDEVPGIERLWTENGEDSAYAWFKAETEFFDELRRRKARGEDPC